MKPRVKLAESTFTGGIEVGELHAFFGHLVQHRGGVFRGAEGPDIAVAKIITENDDEVGLGCPSNPKAQR